MAAAGVNWVLAQTWTEGPDQLLEAVKLCVQLGMDVNQANSMGITALHGAANRGSDEIVRYLVSAGRGSHGSGQGASLARWIGRRACSWRRIHRSQNPVRWRSLRTAQTAGQGGALMRARPWWRVTPLLLLPAGAGAATGWHGIDVPDAIESYCQPNVTTPRIGRAASRSTSSIPRMSMTMRSRGRKSCASCARG